MSLAAYAFSNYYREQDEIVDRHERSCVEKRKTPTPPDELDDKVDELFCKIITTKNKVYGRSDPLTIYVAVELPPDDVVAGVVARLKDKGWQAILVGYYFALTPPSDWIEQCLK